MEHAQGGARLSVLQGGFPTDAAADAFYAGCQAGWKSTFEVAAGFDPDADTPCRSRRAHR